MVPPVLPPPDPLSVPPATGTSDDVWQSLGNNPNSGDFKRIRSESLSREAAIRRQQSKLPGYVGKGDNAVLGDYLNFGSDAMNARLRGEMTLGEFGLIDANIAKMNSLMSPLQNDMTLYRGASLTSNLGGVVSGDVIEGAGFISTSRSFSVASDFVGGGSDGVLFQIHARAGTRAIITNPKEAEVILPHGARMRVLDVRRITGGPTVYGVEITD
jgi:hypothetical protein